MLEIQQNKDIARRFLQALGLCDAAALAALTTDDVELITKGSSIVSGRRDYATMVATCGALGQITKNGFEFRILQLTAEEDRVAAEVEGFSTLVNGTPYNNQYHFLFFIRGGKIYRLMEYLDTKLADAALAPLLGATPG